MIELNEDNTFTMSMSYLGKGDAGQKKTGSFTWDDAEREITLKGLSDATLPVYKVGENRLIPIHSSIPDAPANQYTLTKSSHEITNRYWRLVRINNAQVTASDRKRKEPHLILVSIDSTVMGNGSCNNFRGTYEMTASDGLSFSPLAATKMACMGGMEIENQFLKALTDVSSYKVSGDSLFLFDAQRLKSVTFVVGHFD